ncbi:hypothetical protein Tsubulata_028285, partial [Turnera subulata]
MVKEHALASGFPLTSFIQLPPAQDLSGIFSGQASGDSIGSFRCFGGTIGAYQLGSRRWLSCLQQNWLLRKGLLL